MSTRPLNALLRRYLARRLLAPGIVFVLIVATVLGARQWSDIRQAQELQTRTMARYVSTYLESAEEAVDFLARFAEAPEFAVLASIYRENSRLFERLLLLDGRGDVLQAHPDTGVFRDFSRLISDADPERTRGRISAPYLAPLMDRPTVSLFGPRVGDAMVAGELNLGSLQDYIAGSGQAHPGIETFITDGFGTVIAHPDRTVVARQTNFGHLPPVRRALDGKTGYLGVHRNQGAWRLFSVAETSRGGWLVFGAHSARTHLASLAGTLALFAGLLLLLLGATACLLARKLQREVSRPLESFARTVSRLEKGDLEPNSEGPEKTFAELDILRRRFSEMARTIGERERSLRESERKHRRLIENIGREYCFYQRSVEERFLYLSPSAEAMLGYAPEELLDRPNFGGIFVENEINARARENSRRALEGRETGSHEVEVRHRNGEIRLLEAFEVPVRDFRGEIVGLDGIARDITERRRVDEARRAEERRWLHVQKLESLGVLAGGIAHDFNNLLAAIQGNLELAMRRTEPDSPARNGIEKAYNAGRKAAELTRQMLAYSGKGQFVVGEIDLGDLVRENIAMLRAVMAKTVTLDLRPAEELPPVLADAGQIQQVVLNLITNASEAMEDRPGTLTLVTGAADFAASDLAATRTREKPEPGPYVFLEVRDTGCGMDEEVRQRLFDPFFSTKFAGRGLGMAAVLGIVQGHGGAVFVESEPGRGSVFRILFPAATPTATESAGAAPAPEKRPDSRPAVGPVLVVDDESMVREFCADALEVLGYSSLQAVDGEDAVRIFREHGGAFHCVILDLTMPRMNGIVALHEMRQIRPDIHVILCSGYNEQDAIREQLRDSPVRFLKKPFGIQQLQDELGRISREGAPPEEPV